MLSLRLQRVQLELTSHRLWLSSFTRSFPSRRYASTAFDPISKLSSGHPSRDRKREHGNVKAAVKRKAWKQPKGVQRPSFLATQEGIDPSLQATIQDYNIKAVIHAYQKLPEKRGLLEDQVRSLAQCVQECARRVLGVPEKERSREDVGEIVEFATQLVKDIRNGKLEPSIPAHVHLLGVFKETDSREEGKKFWQWLEAQTDDYVDTNCYAVAIDILVVDGSPLEDLEDLYRRALARFPGTFSAYHLSPNAIVPDRERNSWLPNLPVQLLQSITRARLMRGDTKGGYLGLDTAFRLYPTTVNERYLKVFLKERPTSELYTIYAMFCRAGIPVSGATLKTLLVGIRANTNHSNARGHIASLRTVLAALHLHLSTNGNLPANSVNELIILATQTIRLNGVRGLKPQFREKLVAAVLGFTRRATEVFARYGVLPTTSTFNSIITNLGGYGQSKQIIPTALADMSRLDLQPNDVTRRSILAAAGVLKDRELVIKHWQELVEARRGEGKAPEQTDLRVFIKAAKRVGEDFATSFARPEYDKLAPTTPEWLQQRIEGMFAEDISEPSPGMEEITSAGSLLQDFEDVNRDLAVIDVKTRHRPAILDLSDQALPVTLISNKTLDITDTEMRKIYDEYTTEQTSETQQIREPAVQDTKPVPKSTTGITVGELRYENWKCVNYLLWLSDKHDRAYEEIVDAAIEKGVRPPPRSTGIMGSELEEMRLRDFGLSSPRLSTPATSSEEGVMRAREMIKGLRTVKEE